jgi:hypothetical protein
MGLLEKVLDSTGIFNVMQATAWKNQNFRRQTMKAKTLSLMALGLGVILTFVAPQTFAQTRPEYIPLGGGVKGVLYRPDSNPSPNVAVIIIHRTANYLQHAACTRPSQRGLMVLCMNSRFDNNKALVNWELIALDVRRGVDYLKNTQKTFEKFLTSGCYQH